MRRLLLPILGLVLIAASSSADEPKIVLPKDAKAAVVSYDPGAGGFIRKGEAPYLKILADGSVTITDLHSGTKTEAKLAAKELDALLKFIVNDAKFLDVTEKGMNDAIKRAAGNGPFIAVGGAGTAKIGVALEGKSHEVSFRAAETYMKAYPNAAEVPQFVAVEKKLSEYARTVAKGK
jgi:hypothetical protein